MALVEKFLFLDTLGDRLVNLCNLIPFLSLDEVTSLREPINDSSIVVSEGNLSNLDFLIFVLLESKIIHSCDSLLKLQLNVELELSSLTHWIGFVIIKFLPVLVLFLFKIKLDGVVTGSDCLDIPVDVLGLLDTLDVVKVDNGEEIDKNGDASNKKTKDLSIGGLGLRDTAWNLDVEERFSSTVT